MMEQQRGLGQHLGSVRAVITNGPTPWPEVWIAGEDVLRAQQGEERIPRVGIPDELFVTLTDDYSLLSIYEQDSYPPRLWRTLLDDWLPVFREYRRRQEAVGNFYEQYGPLTRFGAFKTYESLEAALQSLEWLGTLARVTQWLKDERYGPLWDWFKTPIGKRDGHKYFSATIPGVDGTEELELAYTIYYIPGGINDMPTGVVHRNLQEEVTYPYPKDDAELASETWKALMNAVWDKLREIPLSVVLSDFSHTKEPAILWGFETRCVLDAAFLQWFFEELGYISLPKCEGCGNIVPPGREKWCSTTCRNRVYKQRQRSRAKKGGEKEWL